MIRSFMVIPVIWASRKDRKWPTTPIFPALITALTAVPAPSLGFLTRQSTGRDISSISSPLFAARWSISSASSNANLGTGKPCIADSGRMRTVCTRCLPAPIYTPIRPCQSRQKPLSRLVKGILRPFICPGMMIPHKLWRFSLIMPAAWNMLLCLLPFV